MKIIGIVMMFVMSFGSFATETLKTGLYLPQNGGCAYEVVKQNTDSVVVIFRHNPTSDLGGPCADGIDYPIKVDVIDSKTFVDIRNGVTFNFYQTTTKLKRGLYLAGFGDACAYQVIEQKGNTVVIIFRQNPTVSTPATCATGMDYPINVDVVDTKTFVDVRNGKKFKYYNKY
jgi:hypothetical protein